MDYHLKPIGKACAGTGEPLRPGDECYSVLIERNGEMQRLDFSQQAWQGPPEDAIGCWKTVVPEPVETKPTLDPDALMRYFEQLSEDANPAREPLRYVIALMLLQKRRLRLEGSRPDHAGEILELSGAHAEGAFEVRNSNLGDDEIRRLQAELDAYLASEWN